MSDSIDEILFSYQQWVVDGQGRDIRLPGTRLTHEQAKQALSTLVASIIGEDGKETLSGTNLLHNRNILKNELRAEQRLRAKEAGL